MLSLLIFPPDIYVYFWTFYSIHLVCVPFRIWNCKQRNLLCQLEQKRGLLKSPGGLSREGQRIRPGGCAARKLASLEDCSGEDTVAAATSGHKSEALPDGTWGRGWSSGAPTPCFSHPQAWCLHHLPHQLRSRAAPAFPLPSPNPGLMWDHLVGRV